MRVAYLTSLYPDVSHTFILREVRALRQRGMEIETFSVRRHQTQNVLGEEATEEATKTSWLVPAPPLELLIALAWGACTRPLRLLGSLAFACKCGGGSLRQTLKWSCYWLEAVLLARRIVRRGCRHLHCHFGNAGASAGLLAARIANVPYSVTIHGSELNEIEHYRLPDKVAAAAFIACVSEFGRDRLREACPPEHWNKLHLVRCGVETETQPCLANAQSKPQFEPEAQAPGPDPPDQAQTKASLTKHLLCVGRLSPEKGHLVLLDALHQLQQRGIRFCCTLVGDGPQRRPIEQRLEELRLTDRVTLTGSLPPANLDPLYSQADVVALASHSEGVPVVLMEAMARGVPVVATHVGGVSELVQPDRTGLLVPPGDPQALANALADVLENPSAAQARAAHAREWVCHEFNPAVSAQRLEALFAAAQDQPTASPKAENVSPKPCPKPHPIENS